MKERMVKIKNYHEAIKVMEKLIARLKSRHNEIAVLVDRGICDDYALRILDETTDELKDTLISILYKDSKEKKKHKKFLEEEEEYKKEKKAFFKGGR